MYTCIYIHTAFVIPNLHGALSNCTNYSVLTYIAEIGNSHHWTDINHTMVASRRSDELVIVSSSEHSFKWYTFGTTNVFFRQAAITNHLSCDQKPWKNGFAWRVQYTSVLYYTRLPNYEKDYNKPANQDIFYQSPFNSFIKIMGKEVPRRFGAVHSPIAATIAFRSNGISPRACLETWGCEWNPPPNGKRLRYIDPGGDCYLEKSHPSQVMKGCAIPILWWFGVGQARRTPKFSF